ncbi:MAG: hypothetical protein ACLUEQ_11095 [Cloacibacillus evryensis]
MKHSGKLMAALAAAGLMVLFGAGAALCAEQTRDSISVTGYASQESEPDMAAFALADGICKPAIRARRLRQG